MNVLIKLTTAALLFSTTSVNAFELTSDDISEGRHMDKLFEYSGWGCDGSNLSPHLIWSDIPVGTKSFALTAYDPDAPTESGFWHWVAIDLPKQVTFVERGVKLTKLGAKLVTNDFGGKEFGGACPPEGHGMHRYQFTVWAMPNEKMNLAETASPAVVGFYLNNTAIDKATLTATYHR